MGRVANANSEQQTNPHNPSQHPTMQAHCSLPLLRIGLVYCPNPSQIITKSKIRISKFSLRMLWGDSDNEDDESLPSPLPRINVDSEEVFPCGALFGS
jgi:hypothetical protein